MTVTLRHSDTVVPGHLKMRWILRLIVSVTALAPNHTWAQVPPRYAISTSFAVGQAPGSVVLADLNRDDNLDIIVANEQSHSLTILLGDGIGQFVAAPGSPVPAGHMPNDVAAADFNGDGRADLVTDGWETDEVEILLGDGRGGFAAHATERVGRHPYQRVRAWDVNRDGNVDIVTANLRGAGVTVLLGDGRGEFQNAPRSPFAANPFPTALARGDFNGDGHVDLAVTNSPSNSGGQGQDGLTVLLAEPSGGWRSAEDTPVPTGAAPTQIAAGDLDGDGRDEIVVSNMNSGTVSTARLETNGRILIIETTRVGRHPKGIAIGDLNGDRKPDLVVANNGDNDIAILLAQ